MAEQQKQAQEEKGSKKNCANCNKPVKRIAFYYRNGNFFCGKNCFKLYDKKMKEEKLKKLEEEKKKQEEEAKKKVEVEQVQAVAPEQANKEKSAGEQPA
jgi:recombinational DNA repair protein (RecF pathway)